MFVAYLLVHTEEFGCVSIRNGEINLKVSASELDLYICPTDSITALDISLAIVNNITFNNLCGVINIKIGVFKDYNQEDYPYLPNATSSDYANYQITKQK